ncbi:MAG: MBL fold metallo-hydrolase [Solobacterium sp.]|nr:MBL fold metallo-hydrolase [Solobacterium sp.]
MDGRTTLYPMVQFRRDTWEIDEFDCASCFLLIGSEKALLIDTGVGLGDLRGAVEMITDKPVIVVLSHNHGDHIGNAHQFEEVWINPADKEGFIHSTMGEMMKRYPAQMAVRQKGCFEGVYKMFRLYPYDLNTDLKITTEENLPVIHDLTDGMQFDLGDRVVTAYDCPGHTAGEMVFIDSKERICIAGDALNYNLGVSSQPLERTVRYLKRLQDMSDQYDEIYNNHHDFRALGAPLDKDCLPNAIAAMEDAVSGHIVPVTVPNWFGQDLLLSSDDKVENPMGRTFIQWGRNFVGIDPGNIKE